MSKCDQVVCQNQAQFQPHASTSCKPIEADPRAWEGLEGANQCGPSTGAEREVCRSRRAFLQGPVLGVSRCLPSPSAGCTCPCLTDTQGPSKAASRKGAKDSSGPCESLTLYSRCFQQALPSPPSQGAHCGPLAPPGRQLTQLWSPAPALSRVSHTACPHTSPQAPCHALLPVPGSSSVKITTRSLG